MLQLLLIMALLRLVNHSSMDGKSGDEDDQSDDDSAVTMKR